MLHAKLIANHHLERGQAGGREGISAEEIRQMQAEWRMLEKESVNGEI